MTDPLGQRCHALAGPVTELMKLCIEAQGAPARLADLPVAVAPLREVLERGVAGVDDARYVAWAASAPAVLDALERAAAAGDANAAWRAFTDPAAGFAALGEVCSAYPGW